MKMQNLKLNIKYLFLLLLILPIPTFACARPISYIILRLALWAFTILILIVSIVVFIKYKKNKFLRLASLIIFTVIIFFFAYLQLSDYLKKGNYQKCIENGGGFCNPMPDTINLGC
jgi:glucan phosphoethanolaminetransferase (alkaline phosphatase superfamily)